MPRILLLALFFPIITFAQKQVNLTLFGGFANYSGDLQEKRFTLDQSHAAFGAGISYEIIPKVLIRGAVTFSKLSGDDKFSSKELNRRRNLNFTSVLYDASVVADYSLYDLTERRVTPYAFAGVAMFGFNPYTLDSLGDKYFLKNLSTEGQGLPEYPDRKKYKNVQFAIPFGLGVRFRITDNAYLGYEIGLRKTFTDYIDDVSKTYVDEALLASNRGAKAVELSFRSNELKDVSLPYPEDGTIRGGSKYKDWYYFSGITLSIGLFNPSGSGIMSGKGKKRKHGLSEGVLTLRMPYRNQQHFIDTLDKAGELIRIKTFVDPKLEMAEITDRVSKTPGGGKALLFENTGYDIPVLMNAYGSEKRMCLALGVHHLDDTAKEIENLFKLLSSPKENIIDKLKMLPKLGQFASWMPKIRSGRGECQEVVMKQPDITKLPVITCWPKDGGPFVTLPIIHTRDPHTKSRNVGMYRMQVFGPTLTAMHWHKHKVSAKHFNEYKKLGIKMPVAVALGGDPVYAYSATAPLPENVDEYMLAGFLRKKKVELVKCLTQPDVEVPADADIIIEGFVDPSDELIWEGPFGDHTGYYSLPDWYPRFHITAITHKKNPVYPATIVGIPPQEDAWLGKATERIFLAPIKMTMVPEIIDMEMPVEGVFHNLVITKINKEYAGQGQKVMNAMWGAGQMMFNKILVLTGTSDQQKGEEYRLSDYKQLARDVFNNMNPATDIYFSQGPMDVLDHSCSKLGFGGKMCIDGTFKFEEEKDETLSVSAPLSLKKDAIKEKFPEINDINDRLLAINVPCLIISVRKNRMHHVASLHNSLCDRKEMEGIKMVLYVEHTVDANDLPLALWRFCNNVDPKRDSILAKRETYACMGFDGTIKTKDLDNFQRDWPNIIVADDATIESIDRKWHELGIGAFIPSPSLKYKDQMYGQEAVVSV